MRVQSILIAFASTTLIAALSPATRTVSMTLNSLPSQTSSSSTRIASTTRAPMTQAILRPSTSAVITLPPDQFSLHDPRRKRQRCFNDQGFSVDCATWTGYYYTWGPPGNPYEGGPGEGQDGSGSGEPSTTIIAYAGDASTTSAYGIVGVLLGLLAFIL